MKALVTATCVAVLAAVGVYLWGQFSERQQSRAALTHDEGVRKELFEFAKALPGDDEKVRSFCTRVRDASDQSEAFRQVAANCRALGYL